MRLRLSLLVIAVNSLILMAFLVPLALLVRSSAADRAVSATVVETQSLAPMVASLNDAALDPALKQVNSTGAHQITVFLPDGRTMGAPAARSTAAVAAADGSSLTADAPGGREVLVAVAGLPKGTAVIRTLVPDEELSRGVTSAWWVLGLLGLGLLLVSALVTDQLARALIRPLRAVVAVSHRLAGGNLDARAALDGPREVRQVGSGLNLLADRIGELIELERETVADLSHRLRTPLTALRIDAESLAEPTERARVVADVDKLERTVSDVIRSARRPVDDGGAPACDAGEVVEERVRFWSVLAEEEGRAVHTMMVAGPVPVRVSRDDLSACVDALLGNIFAHTPEGCGFTVGLSRLPDGGGRLTVADQGPGLPAALEPQRGISGGGSTGLGLDIVRRTATNASGAVTLANRPGEGALVTVDFAAPLSMVRKATTDRPGLTRARHRSGISAQRA